MFRAYRTMEKAKRRAHAFSAIVVERLTGLAALVFLGFLSAIYLVYRGPLIHRDWVAGALLLVTVGVLVTWLVWRSGSHEKLWARLKNIGRLEPLIDSIRVININRQHFPGLVGLSVLFQGAAILTVASLFAALNLPGKLIESGFTAAAFGVAGIIPISINGIGVVESSFVLAALEVRLPYAEAVLVALLLRALMLIASISFGLLYAAEPAEDRTVREDTAN